MNDLWRLGYRSARDLATAALIAATAVSLTSDPAMAKLGDVGDADASSSQPDPVIELTEVAEYHDHAGLMRWVRDLGSISNGALDVSVIGRSREGRELIALRVAAPGEVDPDDRSALLIVANVDGDRLLGSEVALGAVERLLNNLIDGDAATTEFLEQHTLYVIPTVNPDAAETFFAPIRQERQFNARPVDADRDRVADEDGPDDLNGDGVITMMRVYDPEKADMFADPNQPRINEKIDRDRGDSAGFVVYVEGVDNDGDLQFNEDVPGGVDINRNFMHAYEEHGYGSGPHQVSEPESLALITFVLDHQNIAAALTYGRHDNLSKTPDGKGSFPAGAPKNIDESDVGMYKHIGERFREITGLKEAPEHGAEGAFFAWAYAQYGVPSFATPLWTRPEPEKEADRRNGAKDEENDEGEDEAQPQTPGEGDEQVDPGAEPLTPSGIGDISQETIDELRAAATAQGIIVTDEMMAQITPEAVEQYAQRVGIEVRRITTEPPPEADAGNGDDEDGDSKEKKKPEPRNKDEAAWLKYSDEQRDGEGFVEWVEIQHPDFEHRVEVGGWAPFFKTNPPAELIPDITAKQVEFILDLGSRLPEVVLDEPEVTRLAPGVYEIKVAVINDGYFPTATAMAGRGQRGWWSRGPSVGRPVVVRLEIPMERIVTGQRINKINVVPGSGGRVYQRWIVNAADDSEITITLYSEKYGETIYTFPLTEE